MWKEEPCGRQRGERDTEEEQLALTCLLDALPLGVLRKLLHLCEKIERVFSTANSIDTDQVVGFANDPDGDGSVEPRSVDVDLS